ncbi:copper resistance protein CopC [Aeromicrobium sp. UC242_57]|uniref:copper resistance protein CopC n=1 Tax=Aeromicrobium sp. UC242_57 TaxID=3374624 RepID=UPI0037B08D54
MLLVLGAGPVSAHTSLTGSDPADGASLDVAPSSITLDFNENIGARPQVAVTAPDGKPVKVTNIKAVNNQITADVADVGQRGTYALAFRVVSADGHPVSTTLTYEVTTGSAVEQVKAPKQQDFLHRHRSHLFWGILAAAVAIGLLLAPLRKRHDSDNA